MEKNTVSQTWTRPLSLPAKIPASADVVIIGGGIVGVSTAWFLARQGVSVALCEKGHIAGEQSGRNWGWVRQQCRSPVELPLMIESLEIWKGLSARQLTASTACVRDVTLSAFNTAATWSFTVSTETCISRAISLLGRPCNR